jgi:hypothetical protein
MFGHQNYNIISFFIDKDGLISDMQCINPILEEFLFVPYVCKRDDLYIAMSTCVYHVRIMKGV